MTEETQEWTVDAHKKFATELFNRAWELFDKKDRTKDDDDEMIFSACASAHHWAKLKEAIDETRWLQSTPRSHNQLANVFISLNRPEPALYHANRCIELCRERGIADFDIAFGYECLARACDLADDSAKRDENIKLAIEAGNAIEKKEDRDFFFVELQKVAGYSAVKG